MFTTIVHQPFCRLLAQVLTKKLESEAKKCESCTYWGAKLVNLFVIAGTDRVNKCNCSFFPKIYCSSETNSSRILSMSGNALRNFSSISSPVLYVATPMGWL